MDPILLVSLAAFGAAAAVGAAVFGIVKDAQGTRAEDRLSVLSGGKTSSASGGAERGLMKDDVLKMGKGAASGAANKFAASLGQWGVFLEQADSPITFDTFLMITGGCAVVGVVGGLIGNAPTPLLPVFAVLMAVLPTMWLCWRRSSRFKKFGKQLPDALELIGRALRSGHSLNSGLNVVVTEMPNPISHEFSLAYEQQNLGVPIEVALKSMLKRMPNLDLKFFVTAVAIQRQTGGDLAEILDKIGHVIRERFKILGTIQALTGEGRLSGAVLMALPIAIFFAVYYLNPDYVMLLFTTPLGKKMIAVGAIMQVFGAITIKKIIDIKV